MLQHIKISYDKECFAMELVVLKVLKTLSFTMQWKMENVSCVCVCVCEHGFADFYPMDIIILTIIHMVCHM